MRLKFKITIFLVLTIVIAAGAEGHDFTGKVGCFECHERLPMAGSVNIFRPGIEKICVKCHNLDKRLSHPVGMIPKIIVPIDLPLDKEGRVSCITCHSVHMTSINKTTGKKTFYLRRILKGKKFCYSCHVTGDGAIIP